MTKDEALSIIFHALEQLNEELDTPIEVGPHTPLFGANAVIDSLSLVSVIVDVETDLADALGIPVSLTDDRAINQPVSPFTDPETLAAYVVMLAG
jgi:acyl carrier protein